MQHLLDLHYAAQQDANDSLSPYRKAFHIPKVNGKEALYFTGNSLGAMPVKAREYIAEELNDWANLGVEGHFHSTRPWKKYHHFFTDKVATLVGAQPNEVVMMNALTVNLHLLMISFYQPSSTRYKIVMEAGAFPSDQYAVASQVAFHGFDPATAIIEISPQPGNHTLTTAQIKETLLAHGESVALVLFGGVNYYTGQYFDLETITAIGHSIGAYVGFDLAHTVGNLPLQLHNWGPDFAVWCTYKYLNAGPGSVSGAFVHQRHAHNTTLPRLAGWWGYKEETRFEMKKHFEPMEGAPGWQLSNAQVMNMAAHLASLELFDAVGMAALRAKSLALTAYLEQIIHFLNENKHAELEIITPSDPNQRGCQLSIIAHKHGKGLFHALAEAGVIVDWREPNVIRMAPVPLYNSFTDICKTGILLQQLL